MPFPEPSSDTGWAEDDPGPVVRPYAVTSGRTRPSRGAFDLVTSVVAVCPPDALGPGRSPEQVAIVRMSQLPVAVAEISARLDLPLSVVRVILGDLLHSGQIAVHHAPPPDVKISVDTLEAMLHGLRSL
jgi:hypothetical protein